MFWILNDGVDSQYARLIMVSPQKHKKYSVMSPTGRTIHFGDKKYGHYKDTTPIKHYTNLDHLDEMRRERYLNRALKIRDKEGNLTYNNPESPNYYALRYLWSYKD